MAKVIRFERKPDKVDKLEKARREVAAVRRLVLRNEPCPRKALAAAAQEGGYSLATLSRLLNRDEDYVPRFVRDGCPLALAAADHQKVADFLGIHPARLGIRDLWRSAA